MNNKINNNISYREKYSFKEIIKKREIEEAEARIKLGEDGNKIWINTI